MSAVFKKYPWIFKSRDCMKKACQRPAGWHEHLFLQVSWVKKIATLVGPAVTQLPIETALKRWRAGRESWIVVVSARKNGPWLVGWCMYICIWNIHCICIFILITYTNRIYQYTYIYDMATQYFQIFWHFWAKTRTMTWIMLSLLVGIKLPQTHKNHRITRINQAVPADLFLWLRLERQDTNRRDPIPTRKFSMWPLYTFATSCDSVSWKIFENEILLKERNRHVFFCKPPRCGSGSSRVFT